MIGINKLSLIFILFIFSSNLSISCKNNEYNTNDTITENNYIKIIKDLKNDYVIDLKRLQSFGQMDVVMYDISRLKKSYQDYQSDSTKFYQAIIDFHQSDNSIVKFLYKYRNDTCFRKISLDRFDEEITNYNSFWTDKMFLEITFYKKMNNIALTLILNYYLNTEQQTIKLFLDAVYIDKKSIKTEKLYKKLDKIFEKYGYEDKENIRNAILKDFGKCIDQSQLTTK